MWVKLNDAEVLKSCIPGSEQLDRIGDNEFQAIATVKVGPVKARFKGKVQLSNLDPPNGYKISGDGEGGVAGLAKSGSFKIIGKNLLQSVANHGMIVSQENCVATHLVKLR